MHATQEQRDRAREWANEHDGDEDAALADIVAIDAAHDAAPECIDGPADCRGTVEHRWPGYGQRGFLRCARHGDARIKREEENRARYFGPEPADFDAADAGETW